MVEFGVVRYAKIIHIIVEDDSTLLGSHQTAKTVGIIVLLRSYHNKWVIASVEMDIIKHAAILVMHAELYSQQVDCCCCRYSITILIQYREVSCAIVMCCSFREN